MLKGIDNNISSFAMEQPEEPNSSISTESAKVNEIALQTNLTDVIENVSENTMKPELDFNAQLFDHFSLANSMIQGPHITLPPGGFSGGPAFVDPIETDPAFQQLPEEIKARIRTDLQNAPDEAAKTNIRKLASDPSFDSLSVDSQKVALQDLEENPSSDEHLTGVRRTCSDMVSLENSGDFQALPSDTKGALRTAMFHFSGKDSARDSLIGFAHNPDFAKLSSANQQRLIGAYLTNTNAWPSGFDNSVYLNNILSSPAFQNMDESMQQQVIMMASTNSADEKSMQAIPKLLNDSNFEQLSAASQKTALDDLAEDPSSDEHLTGVRRTCSDMVSLENSGDFQALPSDTQDALRTAMFNFSGKDSIRDSLIGFAHNPDFARLSSANQQRLIGALLANPNAWPSGFDNSVYLNNMISANSFQNMDESMQQLVITLAGKNSSSEEQMKAISDMLRDPQFASASPEDQRTQLLNAFDN